MRDDQIHRLLRQRIAAAERQALERGGRVRASELEALDQLARLIQIHDSLPKKSRRWPVLTIFCVALVTASVLLFVRVKETDIELDLTASGLSFELPARQVLTLPTAVASVGVSGLREIRVPPSRNRTGEVHAADWEPGDLAVRLDSAVAQSQETSITLAGLGLPEKTRVWVHSTRSPRTFRVSLEGRDVELQVDVRGAIHLAGLGNGRDTRYFDAPSAIHLRASSGAIDVDLTLFDTQKALFRSQLPANGLAFSRVEDRDTGRQVSTIVSGSLFFEALDGKVRNLRPGEPVRFAESNGEFRTLEVADGRVKAAFGGRVRDMTTGLGENRRSLMPTLIEWLKAQHSLSLLWGSAIFVFSMLASLLRWWRQAL